MYQMNISALKKDKKKLIILAAISLSVILVSAYLLIDGNEKPVANMDFSKRSKSVNDKLIAKGKLKNKKANKIIKPAPEYKEAPEFEDFHAITKMYVHAMKPFAQETKQWEADLLSLRLQRDRIKLYQDGALAAEGEAGMYKWRELTAKYKAGEVDLIEDSESNPTMAGSEDIRDFENLPSEVNLNTKYRLSDIRLTLFAPGNKYSGTTASFLLGKEPFFRVKVDQVFASQFRVVALNDSDFCATIRDLNSEKESRVCGN